MRARRLWLSIFLSILFTGIIFLLLARFRFSSNLANVIQSLGIPSEEASFVAIYPIGAIFSLSIVLILYVIIRVDKPNSWKEYLAIRTFDGKGVLYAFLIAATFNLTEVAFLNLMIFKPLEQFLISFGLPSSPTFGSVPDQYLFLNIVVLVLFWWIEVPEELFFRGYVQNRLQEKYGKNVAMLLSVVIWDLWHINGVAQYLRRFFSGLIAHGLIFRWRQNSYPVMLEHSIGNRIGTAIALINSHM